MTTESKKPSLQEKLKALMNEYAGVALGTYLGIFVAVFGGFVAAIKAGFEVDGTAGSASMLAAAYVATKATQPLRILATLLLTPLVAKVIRPKNKPIS